MRNEKSNQGNGNFKDAVVNTIGTTACLGLIDLAVSAYEGHEFMPPQQVVGMGVGFAIFNVAKAIYKSRR